jgi:hypothetical protein
MDMYRKTPFDFPFALFLVTDFSSSLSSSSCYTRAKKSSFESSRKRRKIMIKTVKMKILISRQRNGENSCLKENYETYNFSFLCHFSFLKIFGVCLDEEEKEKLENFPFHVPIAYAPLLYSGGFDFSTFNIHSLFSLEKHVISKSHATPFPVNFQSILFFLFHKIIFYATREKKKLNFEQVL